MDRAKIAKELIRIAVSMIRPKRIIDFQDAGMTVRELIKEGYTLFETHGKKDFYISTRNGTVAVVDTAINVLKIYE